MQTLYFPGRFVACDLKIGRYRLFIVLILNFVLFKVMFTLYLDQHELCQRSFIKYKTSGER